MVEDTPHQEVITRVETVVEVLAQVEAATVVEVVVVTLAVVVQVVAEVVGFAQEVTNQIKDRKQKISFRFHFRSFSK
jgi:hypothetical protein